VTYGMALLILLFIDDYFKGLVYSQIILSIQLPWTIFLQIYLTSSTKVMGKYANSKFQVNVLASVAAIVTLLNVLLLRNILF
jgi:manganese transport protein